MDMKIYLSGGMTGITVEEQMRWRNMVMNELKFGQHDYDKEISFCSPPNYYGFDEIRHKSEREEFEFYTNQLRTCNLVIVNFNVPNSIGTAMELMLARELHIPIIGLNKDGKELHPWLIECCTRVCDDMKELTDHVVDFYLN